MSVAEISKNPRFSFLHLPCQEIKKEKCIGNGSFGNVYLGKWAHIAVAIKELNIESEECSSSKADLTEFEKEVHVMHELRHRNVVLLYGICDLYNEIWNTAKPCLIMEYCAGGPLSSKLWNKNTQQIEWSVRLRWALEIATGLSYLHSKKVLHRDLKSPNILIDEHMIAKIADFGLARIRLNSSANSNSTLQKKMVGTTRWMAPEIISEEDENLYTQAADIYSYAMIVWELAACKKPYASIQNGMAIVRKVEQGGREEIPEETPLPLKEVIIQCWKQNPQERMSLATVIKTLKEASSVPTFPVVLSPSVPPEETCPLITRIFRNPRQELSLDDSIELLTTCIQYGNERAKRIQGKDAIIVIGNTGAGKSTFINYLAGCKMELKSPHELVIEGFDPNSILDDIVVVTPPEKGGTYPELMPIGHTKESKTFMPQIEIDPDQHLTYCDCPGFLDNRGEEINIANAVNIRTALTKARSVKVIILINYHSLKADRARGLSDMLKICTDLFGHSKDNKDLLSHQNSLLLGVTQVPLTWKHERVKKWLAKDTPEIMHVLSERLFLSDPLDRPLAEGGWNRAECLSHIKALPPIENLSAIFKTVLTDSDEKKLLAISEKMGEDIEAALQNKNYSLAALRLRHLQSLRIIEHISVERLLNQNSNHIDHHFRKIVSDFKDHCNFEHFSLAKALLQELTNALEIFGKDLNEIDLEHLQNYYRESESCYKERIEKERIREERLQKAQGRIEELSKLLEEQNQSTHEQLRGQAEKYQQMSRKMEEDIEAIKSSSIQIQETLEREMHERLAKKDIDLARAISLNQEKTQAEIIKEKKRIEDEYHKKIEKAQKETEVLLKQFLNKEQEFLKTQKERDTLAEKKICDMQKTLERKLQEQLAKKDQDTNAEKIRLKTEYDQKLEKNQQETRNLFKYQLTQIEKREKQLEMKIKDIECRPRRSIPPYVPSRPFPKRPVCKR